MSTRTAQAPNDAHAYVLGIRALLDRIGAHDSALSRLHKFLADHGREMHKAHKPLPKCHRGKMRQCYANAYRLAHRMGYAYCEGFATSDIGLPVEHAWVMDRTTGEVLDPTWNSKGRTYFGWPVHRDFAARIMVRTGVYGLLPAFHLWAEIVPDWHAHPHLLIDEHATAGLALSAGDLSPGGLA